MTDNKKGVNPAAVGLAGVAIGVAAGAAAVALSNKDNRKKLQKTVKDFKAEGSKKLDEWKNKAQDMEKGAKKQLESAKSKLNKTKDEATANKAS